MKKRILELIECKIFIMINLIVLLVVLFLGTYYCNKKNSESIVQAKAMEQTDKGKYPYICKQGKVQWIYDALNHGHADQEDQKVSESEFIVLMYYAYNVQPKNADLSDHWADDYYLSAEEYGYPVSSLSDRDKPLSFTHAAELLAATQGEYLKGYSAVQFLLDNHLISNKYSTVSDFKRDETLTREDALELCKSISDNGLYQFQNVIKTSDKKQSLVAIGDSISLGFGIDNSAHQSKCGYPNIIGEKSNDLNVMNLSSIGLTSQVLAQKVNIPMYRDKLAKANFIIINIGSADLQSAAKEVLINLRDNGYANVTDDQTNIINDTVDRVKNNIPKIIADIRSYSKAPILLYNVYNPIPEGTIGSTWGNNILERVNDKIKDVAIVNKDVFYLDCYSAFKGKQDTLLIKNNTHPNTEGQEVLAKLSLEKINEINSTGNKKNY